MLYLTFWGMWYSHTNKYEFFQCSVNFALCNSCLCLATHFSLQQLLACWFDKLPANSQTKTTSNINTTPNPYSSCTLFLIQLDSVPRRMPGGEQVGKSGSGIWLSGARHKTENLLGWINCEATMRLARIPSSGRWMPSRSSGTASCWPAVWDSGSVLRPTKRS